ncbi:FMN-binding protein [bacterium]|nr:FMN-binding protein [bacterium]
MPAVALTVVGVGFVSLLDGSSSGSVGLTAVDTNPVVDPNVPTTIVADPNTTAPVAQPTNTTLAPTPVAGSSAATPVATAAPAATAAPVTAAPVTAAPITAAPANPGACDGDVVASPSAQFRYGVIQLQTQFTKANVLCNVTVLQFPNDRRTSVQINNYALPIYNQEAVQNHSAKIRAISGATYSWQAYVAALQAVLDSRP